MLQFLYKIRFLLPVGLFLLSFLIRVYWETSVLAQIIGILIAAFSGYLLATIGYLTVRKNAKAQEKSK